MLFARSVCALILAIGPTAAAADEVNVAVSANFEAPMSEIAASFFRDKGHTAKPVYGSTGSLFARIEGGAPFHVFLAADFEEPAKLIQDGLADGASRFTYATGHLVLWSVKPGFVDPEGAVLRGGNFKKLAIADPTLAPYGRAAMETLTELGLADELRPKLAQGADVAQDFRLTEGGSAELGFVAASEVMREGKITVGSAWIVPDRLHHPIRQDAVLLNAGKKSAAAKAFVAYLKTKKVKAIIRRYGYSL